MDMHRHAMKAKGNFNICSDTDIRTWDLFLIGTNMNSESYQYISLEMSVFAITHFSSLSLLLLK